jgi:hypothetical protein
MIIMLILFIVACIIAIKAVSGIVAAVGGLVLLVFVCLAAYYVIKKLWPVGESTGESR